MTIKQAIESTIKRRKRNYLVIVGAIKTKDFV